MKPLKRRVGQANYTQAGSVTTIELPRNFSYRKLMCRLAGSVVVAGGSGAGAPHVRGAYRVISRVELIANGRDTILSLPGEAFEVFNRIDYGCAPSSLNPTNDSAATYPFNASFIIDLALKRGVRPIDTLFPALGMSTLDLKITWGAGADMFTGAVDFTSATIQTTTELVVESFEEIGELPKGIALNKIFMIDRVVTAASTNYQIQIPTGNTYRGFLFHTNVDNVPVDTMLDGISIESGTVVYQKWLSIEELIDYNKLQYGLESSLVGWYNVDFMDSDGFISEILDARNLSGLDAIINVALPGGTTRRVVVYPQEVILPAA